MTRVSTYGNYQSALLDLTASQTRAAEAQKRVATQKNATDLVGFGRSSEVLSAFTGSQARLQGFIDGAKSAQARLTTQDLAMNQVGDGVEGLKSAIENALAADSAVTLMTQAEGQFQAIRSGLNAQHQGVYLFAGAAAGGAPFTADSLAALAAAPSTASTFANDQIKTASRVAEGSTLETGVLADDLGTGVMDVLRDLQTFATGAGAPLNGKLTDAQKSFLTAQLSRLKAASQDVTDQTARSGAVASRIDSLIDDQQKQSDALDALIGQRADADLAKAYSDLQMSQMAIQASAQVIAQLRQSSLLNYLN